MAEYIRLRGSSRRGGGFFKKFFLTLIILAVAAAAVAAYFLFELEKPQLVLEKQIRYLGGKVDLPLQASDAKSGIRSLRITLTQGTQTATLMEKNWHRQAWFKTAGPQNIKELVPIDAQKAGIREGQAELVIAVRDFSLNDFLRGNETIQRIPVIMDTKPPKVTVINSQRSIKPGGSSLVLYTLEEDPVRHGVVIDDSFFKGYPTAKPHTYVAYFALPWNGAAPKTTRVVAFDEAGNEGTLPFAVSFKSVKEKHDKINLSDSFFHQKLPEFEQHYPEMEGSMLNKYLYINSKIRQQNNETIAAVCQKSEPTQLWKDRFFRMPGAVRAMFADQRTYLYNGQAVDNQTHLGVDIASTAQAEVKAANGGKIVYADYLGIYGNMIMIDHGQGIFSLYSHLSSINTSVGTMVRKNEIIGHTGLTGMAAGDHLHFSMLVNGIFVTPREWWDQHWIDMNIKRPLHE